MKFNISRIRVLSLFIVCFAAVAISRLFFIQVVEGEEYALAANRQYTQPSARVFDRGTIFYKEKGGELASAATLQSGYTVAINPKLVLDAEALYGAFTKILPLDKAEFLEKAGKYEDPYEEIAKRVSEEDAEKLSGLGDKSLQVYRERWRFYPGREMGARVLGFVGYNNDNTLAGRHGLERYYEEVLGREDDGLYVNFFAEVFSDLSETFFENGNREGDIVLTIEPTVEKELHEELSSVMEEWNSDLVGGVIIHPMTGEIYAMDVLPTFDPNNLKAVKDPRVLGNPLVENVYEMGSIVKPVVMAAALDAGAVSAKTTYEDKGFVELDGKRIENYDGKGRGVAPMQEVLSQSLNTGMVFVEKKLGHERFREYMKNYGFGEETGIDLPNETHGLVSNLTSTRDIEYATASFGQGIAVTPIAMVRALAVLANGGTLIEPHLIDTIDYKGGFSRKPEYTNEREAVIGKSASEEITRMLVHVVDHALLGGSVKIPEYSIAAKTGTAQMVKEGERGYEEGKYLHSFFGYFPAYEPKFLVFLYTVNPKGATFASHTLTHPFIRLAKFLLHYYEVPPDRS